MHAGAELLPHLAGEGVDKLVAPRAEVVRGGVLRGVAPQGGEARVVDAALELEAVRLVRAAPAARYFPFVEKKKKKKNCEKKMLNKENRRIEGLTTPLTHTHPSA